MVGNICTMTNTEVEDLFPTEFLAKIITKRYFRMSDDDFEEVVDED
jgi:hypothetical protein